MKKIPSFFFLAIVSVLLSSQAHALFEARVSYGLLATNADLSPLCPTCSADAPSIVPTYGLGADAILTLPIPLIPGVGLRYENMGLTAGAGGVDFKADYTRTALILNWRPIDSFLYLGPILTYGISHSTKLTATDGGTKKADFSADSVSSYSVGLEAGLKLIGFSVGAEVGYLDFRWNDAEDSTGNAPTQDINMSGTYAKIILGFSI